MNEENNITIYKEADAVLSRKLTLRDLLKRATEELQSAKSNQDYHKRLFVRYTEEVQLHEKSIERINQEIDQITSIQMKE